MEWDNFDINIIISNKNNQFKPKILLSMKLDNTIVAIVTGGTSGLGEATVYALLEKGVRVFIADRNEEKGI